MSHPRIPSFGFGNFYPQIDIEEAKVQEPRITHLSQQVLKAKCQKLAGSVFAIVDNVTSPKVGFFALLVFLVYKSLKGIHAIENMHSQTLLTLADLDALLNEIVTQINEGAITNSQDSAASIYEAFHNMAKQWSAFLSENNFISTNIVNQWLDNQFYGYYGLQQILQYGASFYFTFALSTPLIQKEPFSLLPLPPLNLTQTASCNISVTNQVFGALNPTLTQAFLAPKNLLSLFHYGTLALCIFQALNLLKTITESQKERLAHSPKLHSLFAILDKCAQKTALLRKPEVYAPLLGLVSIAIGGWLFATNGENNTNRASDGLDELINTLQAEIEECWDSLRNESLANAITTDNFVSLSTHYYFAQIGELAGRVYSSSISPLNFWIDSTNMLHSQSDGIYMTGVPSEAHLENVSYQQMSLFSSATTDLSPNVEPFFNSSSYFLSEDQITVMHTLKEFGQTLLIMGLIPVARGLVLGAKKIFSYFHNPQADQK